MSRTAEQVLAELAAHIHSMRNITWTELHAMRAPYLPEPELHAMTAPYLPKPESDRLTVAAEECWSTVRYRTQADAIPAIRAIIARVVAAAEPSDDTLSSFASVIQRGGEGEWSIAALRTQWTRAALKGEVK